MASPVVRNEICSLILKAQKQVKSDNVLYKASIKKVEIVVTYQITLDAETHIYKSITKNRKLNFILYCIEFRRCGILLVGHSTFECSLFDIQNIVH